MSRKVQSEETPVVVQPLVDPLEMTVRDLLLALVERGRAANDGDWINIRGETYPWRRIVAAAERGECEVSRVGRRLMMRRSELSRWLARHRIGPGAAKPKKVDPDTPKGKYADVVERVLRKA